MANYTWQPSPTGCVSLQVSQNQGKPTKHSPFTLSSLPVVGLPKLFFSCMKIWGNAICIYVFKMNYTHKMLPGDLFKFPIYLFVKDVEQELVSPLKLYSQYLPEGLTRRHE